MTNPDIESENFPAPVEREIGEGANPSGSVPAEGEINEAAGVRGQLSESSFFTRMPHSLREYVEARQTAKQDPAFADYSDKQMFTLVVTAEAVKTRLRPLVDLYLQGDAQARRKLMTMAAGCEPPFLTVEDFILSELPNLQGQLASVKTPVEVVQTEQRLDHRTAINQLFEEARACAANGTLENHIALLKKLQAQASAIIPLFSQSFYSSHLSDLLLYLNQYPPTPQKIPPALKESTLSLTQLVSLLGLYEVAIDLSIQGKILLNLSEDHDRFDVLLRSKCLPLVMRQLHSNKKFADIDFKEIINTGYKSFSTPPESKEATVKQNRTPGSKIRAAISKLLH